MDPTTTFYTSYISPKTTRIRRNNVFDRCAVEYSVRYTGGLGCGRDGWSTRQAGEGHVIFAGIYISYARRAINSLSLADDRWRPGVVLQ